MLGQQLDKKIENALNNNHSSVLPYEGFNSKPPFVSRIVWEPLPLHFRLPQLEVYDGITDPINYLETFKMAMLLQGALDIILCRAFPPTLKGTA